MTDPAFQKLVELVRLLTEALQSEHLTDYARSRMLMALTLAGEIYTSQHVAQLVVQLLAEAHMTPQPAPGATPGGWPYQCDRPAGCSDPRRCNIPGACLYRFAQTQ